MELIKQKPNVATARRYGAGVLLAMGLATVPVGFTEASTTHASIDAAKPSHTQPKQDWNLVWQDSFNARVLDERWEVITNDSEIWDHFAQYRQFGVALRNDRAIISSRRHCTLPGEEMSLGNAQVEVCPEGTSTQYSSGRLSEVIPSISGNYRIEVEAKLPLGKGARGAIWANNLEDNDEGLNGGYCIEGSTTPTAEIDLIESYGEDVARASHHVHCEDGELAQVPRVKRFKPGWLKKVHLFSVEKIGNRTTFYVDDEPMRVNGSSPKQFVDMPRDFKEVTRSEYLQAYTYPYGMVFDTRVFDDMNEPNPLFKPPSSGVPFSTKELKIDAIRVYTS